MKVSIKQKNTKLNLRLGAVYTDKNKNSYRFIGLQRKDQFIFQLFDGDTELRQVLLVSRESIETFFSTQDLKLKKVFKPQFEMPQHLS